VGRKEGLQKTDNITTGLPGDRTGVLISHLEGQGKREEDANGEPIRLEEGGTERGGENLHLRDGKKRGNTH